MNDFFIPPVGTQITNLMELLQEYSKNATFTWRAFEI